MSLQKNPPLRSEPWKIAVRMLGYCVRCGSQQGSEPAHRNEGKGMGMKAPDSACAALCRECHMELDQGRTMTRPEKRAEMDRCIVLTHIALAELGVLTINLRAA